MKLTDAATRIELKNILFATDFSEVSETALLFAESITRRYGAKLCVTHVAVPSETAMLPPESWGACEQAIEEATQRDMARLDERLRILPHQLALRHGGVWDVVSELIQKDAIDLLVMGTHGRKGLERLLMGSVAEEIFRQASCPVLTVGPCVPAKTALEAEFKQIIFATDFSHESLAAAPYAISLAQDYQARLVLMHVVTQHMGPLTDSELIVFDRVKELNGLLPPDAELWCRPEYVVNFGDPADCILQAAQERNVDLIVLGVRPPTGFFGFGAATHASTATAHTLVSLAACPVLTVRG